MNRAGIMGSLERSLPAIAGIVLIVAAGGGFKQTLVDTGIGAMIAGWATGAGISALVLGWLVAVAIRLATGSATVATVTAAGILVPLLPTLDPTQTSLLVLAIGAGSLFFSHVNDAGFWLVKGVLPGSPSARTSGPGRSWRPSSRSPAWSWCCSSTW